MRIAVISSSGYNDSIIKKQGRKKMGFLLP